MEIEEKLIRKMENLVRRVTAEEIAGISRENTSDQSRGAGGSRQPSYSPPPEYNAIEMLLDLGRALDQGEYREALPLYFGLKRLLNY